MGLAFSLAALAVISVGALRTRISEILAPGVHTAALMGPAPELIHCFDKLGIHDYQTRGEMRENFQYHQRLVEGAWPVEIKRDSPNVVVLSRELEGLCPRASVLCTAGEAVVATCAL